MQQGRRPEDEGQRQQGRRMRCKTQMTGRRVQAGGSGPRQGVVDKEEKELGQFGGGTGAVLNPNGMSPLAKAFHT